MNSLSVSGWIEIVIGILRLQLISYEFHTLTGYCKDGGFPDAMALLKLNHNKDILQNVFKEQR